MAKVEKTPPLFVREATGLTRELGAFSTFTFVFTCVVSSGINYFIPQLPFSYPGCNVLMSIIIAAIPAIIGAMTINMLLAAMPRCGGFYTMYTRAIDPSIGYIFGGISYWVLDWWCNSWFAYAGIVFLGGGLYMMGEAAGLTGLVTIGQTLQTNFTVQLVIGMIVLAIFGLIDALGTKTMKWAVNIMWLIYMIGGIAGLAVFAMHTPETVPAAWDSVWGAGAYNEIVDVATNAGWAPAPFDWTQTLLAVAVSFWAFTAFEVIAPMGSEVAEPKRSMFWGSTAAAIVITIWYLLTGGLLYKAYGYNFISMYDYVVLGGYTDQLKINPGLEPIVPFFASSLTPNAYLQGIINFGMAMGLFNGIPAGYAACSRTTFAMAFDRFLPEWLASVGRTFRGPWASSLLAFVFSAFSFICYQYGVLVAILDLTFFECIIYLFDGVAALSLPFKRPDLWERGYKFTLGRLPLMAIVGGISLAWTGLFTMMLAIVGLDVISITSMAIIYSVSALIYAFYSYKNRELGMDLTRLFYELPPE